MSERTLFDDPDEATEEAVQRVADNANITWLQAAYEMGVGLSRRHAEWNADDFWREMETYQPDVQTHEPRAFGAVVRQLKRDHVIAGEPVKYSNSKLAVRHSRPIPTYRSLLYAGSTS